MALGQAISTALAEVDALHAEAVTGSFRMALLETWKRWWAVS